MIMWKIKYSIKILFVSIDDRGVGELIKIATERGRMQKKSLKLGICGEHGGDPSSIEFCEKIKTKLRILFSVQSSNSTSGSSSSIPEEKKIIYLNF